MSSGCNSFRPNFWRPNTCTHCYQHRSRHRSAQDSIAMERKTNVKNRAELSRSSECVSVRAAPIEAVKPYAVVKIAEGEEPGAQRGSRERWPRAAAFLHRLKPSSSKRKLVSPPPPSHRQSTTAEVKRCSFKQKSSTLATDIPFTAERTIYQSFTRVPPEKPPRTLSTFLTDAERDAFLEYVKLPNNEVEEFPTVPATSARVAYADSGQLNKEIADLISATLRGIAAESADKVSCAENLWSSQADWSWVQRVAGSKVPYKGTAFIVEEVTQPFDKTTSEVEVCRSLQPHPHLRLVRTQLGTSPSTLHHSTGTLYFLKDHGEAIPLTYLLQEKRQLLSAEAYLHLVLTCFVQVLSAISHLHSNGVCHRNVTADALCATPHGSEWLVAIGDLHCAQQRPPPITGQTYMYDADDLKWSDVSVVPPEVITASNRSKVLDCRLVDSFALGCLVYRMMGEPHPFERNPRLLTQGYKDLPPFSVDPASIRSTALLRVTQRLLANSPKDRMAVWEGLTLCRALLWLPPEWFQELVPARALQHYLAYEQAAMLSALAKQRDTTLGNVLKTQFLLDATPSDLMLSLSVVWQR